MITIREDDKYLTYIDYEKELAEYFNCSIDEIRERNKEADFDKEWKEKVKDKKTANTLYAKTKANLFRQARKREKRLVLYRRILKDLLKTQYSYKHDMYFSEHEFEGKVFPNYSRQNILDYGCGIGDIGLVLSHLGYRVDLLEIGNSELEKFIKWRFKKRFLPCNFIPYGQRLKRELYDVIVCVDVLEHHEDPKRALLDIYEGLRPYGYLFLQYGWHEREEYKELGGEDLNQKFIKPFLAKHFITEDKDKFWLIKK